CHDVSTDGRPSRSVARPKVGSTPLHVQFGGALSARFWRAVRTLPRHAATHRGSKWHAMSHCNRSRDILGLRLGSDWDRHSGRDKSYSDETDSPRKRTLPTPHQANPRCCKTAPTPHVGHILTNPLGCGSSGKNGHQQGCRSWSARQNMRTVPQQTRAARSGGRGMLYTPAPARCDLSPQSRRPTFSTV